MKKVNVKIIITVAVAVILIIGCVTMAFALQGRGTKDITEQKAKEIAFSHAGVQESDISALRITKDTENGSAVYSVEFNAGGKEYDYDIRMSDGDIGSSSYEPLREGQTAPTQAENAQPQTQPAASDNQSSGQPDGAQTSGTGGGAQTSGGSNSGSGAGSSGAAQSSGTGSGGTAVTADQARAIALQHAGVSEADAKFVRVQADYEDGIAVYEVEFYVGNREYDYDIIRSSGKILKYDHDIEGFYAGGSGSGSGAGSAQVSISLEKAKSLALAKVSGATEQNIRIHLDWDDGRPVYEGEIYYNQMEYEFEIDANTGTFLEWGMDYRD